MSDRTDCGRLYSGLATPLGFDDARARLSAPGGMDALFAQSPTRYLAEHAAELRRTIPERPGLKFRVSVVALDTLINFGAALPLACDLAIYSPAPLWPSCDLANVAPGREFAPSNSSVGAAAFSPSIIDLMAWLATVKPLVESDRAVYLPVSGNSSPASLGAGQHTRGPNGNGSTTTARRHVLELASRAFWDDLLISHSLGAVHTLPLAPSELIAIVVRPPGSGASPDPNGCSCHTIRVPYLSGTAPCELAGFLKENASAFDALHGCVRAAIWSEVPSGARTGQNSACAGSRDSTAMHRENRAARSCCSTPPASVERPRQDLKAATDAVVDLIENRAARRDSQRQLAWLTLHVFEVADPRTDAAPTPPALRHLARAITESLDLPADSFFRTVLNS